MIKKFINGLVFGFGFSVAVAISASIWFKTSFEYSPITPTIVEPVSIEPDSNSYSPIDNLSELSLDQKIEHSTAIIVTFIAKDENGIYKTTVSEVLKKNDDVELYYRAGEEFPQYTNYNEYEEQGRLIPKGFIVFMSGNPAQMSYSTSYSDERIISLGGISMALLREKCSS